MQEFCSWQGVQVSKWFKNDLAVRHKTSKVSTVVYIPQLKIVLWNVYMSNEYSVGTVS